MQSIKALCLAALLALPACGAEDDGDGTPIGTGGATGGSGGLPPNSGGTANTGGDGSGGLGAGGGPDPGSGGFQPASGGAPPGSGGSGGGTSTGPRIPQPSGECPTFKSGTQTIMGLSTVIQAGSPGATKGPLLFVWHGTNGSGSGGMNQVPASVRDDIVSKGGMIVAATDNGQVREGQDVTIILGVWYDVGDLKYADQITACAVKNNNIDPNQIYVTGCSAGGLMTGAMLLKRSSYVAAAAPNSGGLVGTLPPEDPNHVPPVLCMHGGTNDNVVINFGDASAALENITKAGALTVDCNHSIGHCRAPAALYENAWTFMKAHPFNVGESPYKGGLPAGFPTYCKVVQ